MASRNSLLLLSSAAALVPLLSGFRLPAASPQGIPDLTRGDPIPASSTHDWTLGASGARGWMYSEKLVTAQARQIAVTEVATGSPADGVLAVGDVILGVGERPFSHDPRTEPASVARSGELPHARVDSGRSDGSRASRVGS